jgi:hypothetical protein
LLTHLGKFGHRESQRTITFWQYENKVWNTMPQMATGSTA